MSAELLAEALKRIQALEDRLAEYESTDDSPSPYSPPPRPVISRKWHPACLCGCELQITAQWLDESIYRHPIPFTITSIQINNVCSEHSTCVDMPDVSDLFDIDQMTGTIVQNRGYQRYPINNPLLAEILYAHLFRHNGQRKTLRCGCTFYYHSHPTIGKMKLLEHPLHSRKCHTHRHDTLGGVQAHIDHNAAISSKKV